MSKPNVALVPDDPRNLPKTAVVRQGFADTEMSTKMETAAAVRAAQVQAIVQAQYVMALQRPRDPFAVRDTLLAACKRPRFAKAALYSKPAGKKKNSKTGAWEDNFAEGLSIRFAEDAILAMGNIRTVTSTIYDDDDKRILNVVMTDLERNATQEEEILVQKIVERSNGKGRDVIRVRKNTYGDPVYVVVATEDEVRTKERAMISKAIRGCALRTLPADLKEECEDQIRRTVADEDAKDPEFAKKQLVDAFAVLSVRASDLAAYLGHSLDRVQPKELARLRGIYTAIKDEEQTWDDVMRAADKEPAKTEGEASKPASNLDELTAKHKAAKEAAPAEVPAPETKAEDSDEDVTFGSEDVQTDDDAPGDEAPTPPPAPAPKNAAPDAKALFEMGEAMGLDKKKVTALAAKCGLSFTKEDDRRELALKIEEHGATR